MASELKSLPAEEFSRVGYYEVIDIDGYLFKNHRLIGIYVENTFVPIEPNILPEWVHKKLLIKRKCILKMELRGNILRGFLLDLESKEEWLITEREVVGPGGFEPPTTRL